MQLIKQPLPLRPLGGAAAVRATAMRDNQLSIYDDTNADVALLSTSQPSVPQPQGEYRAPLRIKAVTFISGRCRRCCNFGDGT